MSYDISLERFSHTDSKKHHNIYLKMDWVRVMGYRSNLQTSLACPKIFSFLFQNMSYHIPLERFFHTDSKNHHDMHLKMDWVREISHRSNLQTRTAPRHTKNIFISKTWHIIHRCIFKLILKNITTCISKWTGSELWARNLFGL